MIDRRMLLAGTGAVAFAATLGRPAFAASDRFTGDAIIGDPDAPVEVIEYVSFTCPHCAAFHQNTYPEFKKAYIDTGKAKMILREVYFDRMGLAASLVARCGGEAGFEPISDMLLKQQSAWSRSNDPLGEFRKIARLNGLSLEEMNACISDRDFASALVQNYQENAEEHEVRSTPTFIINGEKHSGNMSFEQFSLLVDKHVPEGFTPKAEGNGTPTQ